MKAISRITVLGLVVGCIVVFWLMPGINQANDTSYVRLYEDTYDNIQVPDDTLKRKIKSSTNGESSGDSENKKKYRKEEIQPDKGMSKIKASMFSRAVHFQEDLEVPEDSVEIVYVEKPDTIVAQ